MGFVAAHGECSSAPPFFLADHGGYLEGQRLHHERRNQSRPLW